MCCVLRPGLHTRVESSLKALWLLLLLRTSMERQGSPELVWRETVQGREAGSLLEVGHTVTDTPDVREQDLSFANMLVGV